MPRGGRTVVFAEGKEAGRACRRTIKHKDRKSCARGGKGEFRTGGRQRINGGARPTEKTEQG